MTLRELAAKAEVHFGHLSDLENGKCSARVKTLAKLAAALSSPERPCRIEDLMPPESDEAAA
jgi:transcriptional regulator with XRE-family HTH domain